MYAQSERRGRGGGKRGGDGKRVNKTGSIREIRSFVSSSLVNFEQATSSQLIIHGKQGILRRQPDGMDGWMDGAGTLRYEEHGKISK